MSEISFTLEEAVVIHQALLGSLDNLELRHTKAKKEHGADVYDSIKSRHITSLEKIEELVKMFRDKESSNANAE